MTYPARSRVLAALFVAALAALAVPQAQAADVNVNCNAKGSIQAALASLSLYGPNTITIHGTCTEYVDIQQFDHLTIVGKNNAAIVAPSNSTYTLNIRSSRDVVLRNLTVRGQNGAAYFEGCKDCGVYNSTIEGTILVGSMSKLVIFKSVLHANGSWTAFGIFDNSVAFINDCTFEPGSTPSWVGLHVAKGAAVTIGGSTIRGYEGESWSTMVTSMCQVVMPPISRAAIPIKPWRSRTAGCLGSVSAIPERRTSTKLQGYGTTA
jgi:hypothetical protein